MTIKLTTEHVRVVSIFERLVRVHVRDCLINEDTVYFLVEPGKMGIAIGKGGSKIKNVCRALGKNVKIFEHADTPEKLLRKMIPNINSIEIHEGVITISIPVSDKSTVIGKNGKNIKMIREFLNRHFNIKNLRLK
ncbi:MAG: NusA-like transcription termination signal-binding factor [Candidatus Aenigmarchaeota archaeon]